MGHLKVVLIVTVTVKLKLGGLHGEGAMGVAQSTTLFNTPGIRSESIDQNAKREIL